MSGLLGSFGAYGWGKAMGALGLDQFSQSAYGTVGFGALSGGIGAELTGGNFWQGAIVGGVVAGLNHVLHKIQTKSTASVYIETDGVGHVYVEIDGVVYSYGRYNGSYSPASGSLGPLGDGVLLRLTGEEAQTFIANRTSKFPTVKYSVEVTSVQVKEYYDKIYESGVQLKGKAGVYKFGRVVDTYNLIGPGGNNGTTIAYKALNYGGANIRPAQTPGGMLYDFNKWSILKMDIEPQNVFGDQNYYM